MEEGSAEITVERSRFLSYVRPVKTENEAADFISEIRKKNHDARHNCFAYRTGKDGMSCVKCSDDGEPSQTAGRPILDILENEDIRNVCVVVTRYFGGILLGTGGLVRAYGKAAAEGLKNSLIAERESGFLVTFCLDYDLYGSVRYLAEKEGFTITECNFTDKVMLQLLIPSGKTELFLKEAAEKTAGRALPEEKQEIEYCMVNGKAVYF